MKLRFAFYLLLLTNAANQSLRAADDLRNILNQEAKRENDLREEVKKGNKRFVKVCTEHLLMSLKIDHTNPDLLHNCIIHMEVKPNKIVPKSGMTYGELIEEVRAKYNLP